MYIRPIFVSTHKGQKGVLDPLELWLQVVVNLLVWMLVTERGSLGKQQTLITTKSSLQPHHLTHWCFVVAQSEITVIGSL